MAIPLQRRRPSSGVRELEDDLMDILQKAEHFFQSNGRDIDRAIFHHHFGDLDQAGLLAVLGRYQNEDGGFWGLEVD
ncbi:MAG: hypothetical protein WBO48_16855, partial [Candidatus Promineifilaceae bacterium]